MRPKSRPISFQTILLLMTAFIFGLLWITACSSPATPVATAEPLKTAVSPESPEPENVEPTSDSADSTNDENEQPTEAIATKPNYTGIVIDLAAESIPVTDSLLGTNLPAWLNSEHTENETFIERIKSAGTSLIRIPGGSWSNGYNWLACEMGDSDNCWHASWALHPTDFIHFLNATEDEGMYTINMNGTAKEAAALVAFFNGSVDDETVIGVDVLGRDWGTVSQWAQLRTDHGNAAPIGLTYWEIGNEVFAGKPDSGTDCTYEWGWENVWTCDGTEYVMGIGSGENRKEGFIEYVEAMKAVDPTILVGAVGVSPATEWTNWGNKVIAAAGAVMDFYIIHDYGYFDPPASYEAVLALPQSVWEPMMADVEASFAQGANGRSVPVAITEYNLFAFQDNDNEQLMTRAVNMLYLADTLGQMAIHGVDIANQWNIANGVNDGSTDYGLLHIDNADYAPYPQYYVFPLWSQFGTEMLPVSSPYASDTTLSVYAGTDDNGAAVIFAINKTGDPITSNIQFLNAPDVFTSGTLDSVRANSLDSQTVTFNGVPHPAADLSNAPSERFETIKNPFSYTFEPYSITLIRLSP